MLNQWLRIGTMEGFIGFVSVIVFTVCFMVSVFAVWLIGKILKHFGIDMDE